MPGDFGALRVVDLKEECKKRNLTVGGKKAELISRLEEFEASKDGSGEAADKEPASASEQDAALPSGTAEDAEAAAEEILDADKPATQSKAEAAAEEILEADKPSAQNAAGAATDHKQKEPSPAEEEAPDTETHKTRSKGQVTSTEADATAQEAFAEAEAACKAEAEAPAAVDSAEGSMSAKQPEPAVKPGNASSPRTSSAAATATTPAPVHASEVPAVEADASAEDEAAPLEPATQVPTATAGADAADAQLDAVKPKQLAPSGAAAMDVASEQPSATPSEASDKQVTAAPAADKENDKAAAETVPLVATLADAGMGDAIAGEDAELVQYDAQSDDEQAAPVVAQKQTGAKSAGTQVTEHDKSRRSKTLSTSKAVRDESTPHTSARKRGREADEPARDDRKAPRTERRSDVKLSQKEKDKEREQEKDRAKDSKQTNGDPPPGTERRRKHAPISYKPPERTPAQADKHRPATDTSRRESRSDRKPSDTDGAHDLATKKSGLERAVSRTESAHKLSVFERLQRGRGEGGSGSAPPSAARDPVPAPAAGKSKEALPRTTSHSRRNQPTQALRIDGFVRPLTVQKTQAMLSEFGEIQKLWMPSIRTHAFVVFATAEQAEACLKATSGLNWPQGNLGSTLAPKYVTVEEAELAIARAGGGPAPVTVTASNANGLEAGTTAMDATLPAAGHTIERRAGLDERRRSHHDDGNDRRRLTGDAAQQADRASAEAAPPLQVDNPPTLDELFRKTTTKPCLYWLPMTEDQAAERKSKLEAAAAQKVAAGEAPDAAVPVA